MVRCVPLWRTGCGWAPGRTAPGPNSGTQIPSVVAEGPSGRDPPRAYAEAAPLLAALLHVRTHEVLGVLLEHVVDLVEDRVDVLAELLAALLAGRGGAGAVLVVAAASTLAL